MGRPVGEGIERRARRKARGWAMAGSGSAKMSWCNDVEDGENAAAVSEVSLPKAEVGDPYAPERTASARPDCHGARLHFGRFHRHRLPPLSGISERICCRTAFFHASCILKYANVSLSSSDIKLYLLRRQLSAKKPDERGQGTPSFHSRQNRSKSYFMSFQPISHREKHCNGSQKPHPTTPQKGGVSASVFISLLIAFFLLR